MLKSNVSNFKKKFLKKQVMEWKLVYIDFVTLKDLLEPFKDFYVIHKKEFEGEARLSYFPIPGREAI
jgi:hypothetical protein